MRRLIIFRRMILCLCALVGLALAFARPLRISAVELPLNENRNMIHSQLFSVAGAHSLSELVIKYPEKIYIGSEYATLEIYTVKKHITTGTSHIEVTSIETMAVNDVVYGDDDIGHPERFVFNYLEDDNGLPISNLINIPLGAIANGNYTLSISEFRASVISQFEAYPGEWVMLDWLIQNIQLSTPIQLQIQAIEPITDYERGYVDGYKKAAEEDYNRFFEEGYRSGYQDGFNTGIYQGIQRDYETLYYDPNILMLSGVKDELVESDYGILLEDKIGKIDLTTYADIEFLPGSFFGYEVCYLVVKLPANAKIPVDLWQRVAMPRFVNKPAPEEFLVDVGFIAVWSEAVFGPGHVALGFNGNYTLDDVMSELDDNRLLYYEYTSANVASYPLETYRDGYRDGFDYGYDVGLDEGNDLEDGFSWIRDFLSNTVGGFLSIRIYEGVTIGLIIGVPLVLSMVAWVVGLIKGKTRGGSDDD